MLPHSRVLDVLERAYGPCPGFAGVCQTMRWQPRSGHVPRGFAGALGLPEDVRLVLVTAEPGDPYPSESYPAGSSPRAILESVCRYVLGVLESGNDLYHRNLRYILNGCFRGKTFREQLEHVWITDSVLCSAEQEGGHISAAVGRECRMRYLEAQLELFPNAHVVALGGKAQQRLRNWPKNVHPAYSVAPPACNYKPARPSWDAIIDLFP